MAPSSVSPSILVDPVSIPSALVDPLPSVAEPILRLNLKVTITTSFLIVMLILLLSFKHTSIWAAYHGLGVSLLSLVCGVVASLASYLEPTEVESNEGIDNASDSGFISQELAEEAIS